LKFLAALKFLTILPITSKRADTLEEIGGSIVYYPVVGLIIGLMLAALNWLFRFLFPPAVVNGLLIVSLVIISGALHLDGFLDTCDGIAGHKPVEARWQVMHDSRTGAFGVVGAVLLLLLQYVSLNSIPGGLMTVSLILMPVISRWTMVYAIFSYPYARPQGLGKGIKDFATWQRFTTATVITLILALAVAWLGGMRYFYLAGPAIILAVWVIITLMAGFFKKMFAGLTGDTYGAVNEIAEVSVLLLVIMLAKNHWLV